MRAGSCFYLSTPRVPRGHLWVVLTAPEGDPAKVVAVMLLSKKFHTDDTTILQKGDHPFLDRETAVQYSSAELFRVDRIIAWSAAPGCGLHPDVEDGVLRRMQAGLMQSVFTVEKIRDYCKARFGATA